MGLFQNSGIFFKYYVHSEISDDMNKGQKSNNPAKSICQMACWQTILSLDINAAGDRLRTDLYCGDYSEELCTKLCG